MEASKPQVYLLNRQGEVPKRLDAVERLPAEGFVWMDFTRESAGEWPVIAEKLTGFRVHEAHIIDSFNGAHASYFDGTEHYDMLIFKGLTPEACESPTDLIVTKSAAFFLFDGLLITVRAAENVSFQRVKEKFCETKLRFPSTPFGLVHVILDTMVDRYLTTVDELEIRLEHLQDTLLDPKNPFEDWQQLLHYRKQAHAMELLCEHNLETLAAWRGGMRVDLSEAQGVRLNDLAEHIRRVKDHGDSLQKDVEVAVQLYFASITHRSNEIMKIFTVVAVLFMPMTVLTGIWGMNFKHMPELEWRYGYYLALAIIFGVGVGMIYYFKRRRIL